MNSDDFAQIAKLAERDAAEVRKLAEAGAFDWIPCQALRGLESYQGTAPGYNVTVVRANTERGPTYEGMIVPPTKVLTRMAPDLAKYLWDMAIVAALAVSQSGTFSALRFGDTEKREAPPLMSQPPAWLDNWLRTDIEAKRAAVFFRDMINALSMPRVDGDQRTLPLWRVPASGNIYAVDKERKKFTLIKGKTDEWHWKNYAVLKTRGYTVDVRPVTMEIGSGKTSITLFRGEYERPCHSEN